MSQKESVEKGLQYLKSSDEIVGKIVAYCVNAYKADPSDKTLERIRQYVQDTANSISEHVISIGTNLSRIIDYETKELDELTFSANHISQRLYQAQNYMCELYMMKFQTFPRPHPTIHILKQKIPDDQLPKYARPRRAWNRPKEFDYKVLDQVGKSVQSASNDNKEDESGEKAFLSEAAESVVDVQMYKSKNVDSGKVLFKRVNSNNLPSMEMKTPPPPMEQQPMQVPQQVNNYPPPPMQQQQQQQPPPMINNNNPNIPPPPKPMNIPPPAPKPMFAQQFQPPPPPSAQQGPPPPSFQGGGGGGPPPPPPNNGGGGGGGGDIPEDMQRYLKMLKMGVPRQAVTNKMAQEGYDAALLDKYAP